MERREDLKLQQRKTTITNNRVNFVKHLILLLAAVVPLFSLGLSNHGLWSADEPRVAEIGREMALTGNWVVPTLNQRPFLEEPPLYYGTLALTFKAFGISDKVARIPSAVFALASVLVVFFVANLLSGSRTALLSGHHSGNYRGVFQGCPHGYSRRRSYFLRYMQYGSFYYRLPG